MKIQNFGFEVPHTKNFNINWNFLAKTYPQYFWKITTKLFEQL